MRRQRSALFILIPGALLLLAACAASRRRSRSSYLRPARRSRSRTDKGPPAAGQPPPRRESAGPPSEHGPQPPSRQRPEAGDPPARHQRIPSRSPEPVPRDRKKLMVLVSLIIFWIGLILIQRYQDQGLRPTSVVSVLPDTSAPRGESVTPLTRQAKKRAEMPRLRLSQIQRVRPPFEPEIRNIFASIDRSSLLARPKPTSPSPIPPPSDPFVEKAKRLRFIGYAKADDRTVAFVAYGNEVLVVPEAEVFGGQFRIKEIKEDAIIVSSLDGKKEVRLGLGPGPAGAPPGIEKHRGIKP